MAWLAHSVHRLHPPTRIEAAPQTEAAPQYWLAGVCSSPPSPPRRLPPSPPRPRCPPPSSSPCPQVNDFLTAKFVAERRQQKLDRLDEQKFMRLRMKQDRKDKADTVQKLLKASIEKQEVRPWHAHAHPTPCTHMRLAPPPQDVTPTRVRPPPFTHAVARPRAPPTHAHQLPRTRTPHPACACACTCASWHAPFAASRLSPPRALRRRSTTRACGRPLCSQGALDGQKDADGEAVEAEREVAAPSRPSEASVAPSAAAAPPVSTGAAPNATGSPPARAGGGGGAEADDEKEAWEEAPAIDYEAFGEADDFFAQEGDLDAEPLNLPSAFDDDDDVIGGGADGFDSAVPHFTVADADAGAPKRPFLPAAAFEGAKAGYVFKKDSQGLGYYLDALAGRAPWEAPPAVDGTIGRAPWDVTDAAASNAPPARPSAPPAAANDPWAAIDSSSARGHDTRAQDAAAADRHAAATALANAEARKKEAARVAAAAAAAKSAAPKPMATKPAATKPAAAVATMQSLLASVGLGAHYGAFEAAGLTDAAAAAAMHRADAQAFSAKLTALGLKMGQRQKVVLALGSH